MRRAQTAGAILLTIGLGLGVRYGAGGAIGAFVPVALWTVLVYLGLLFISPRARPFVLFVSSVSIGIVVELLQLTPAPAWLSAKSILFEWAVGSTFDRWDLPAYLIGGGSAAWAHRGWLRSRPAVDSDEV